MKKIIKNSYPVFLLGCTLAVFVYFFMISRLTPLAGDDWGYAINGLKGNPFVMLVKFYVNWSGRVVSELWGLIVAPRKALWNVLNPLLFSCIYLMLNCIANKKKSLAGCGLVLVLMLTVSEYLRMETYTWIMGTTYVIPLCLSLIYFWMIESAVFEGKELSEKNLILSCVILFLIGMTMENIAAMMIVGIVLAFGYGFVEKKKLHKGLIVNFMCSVAGFLVLRLSPGSTFRTQRDHGEWMNLSLFEKIENQLENFFRYTFIENKYLIFLLAILVLALLLFKGLKWMKEHRAASIVIFLSECTALLFSCANFLGSKLQLHFLTSLIDVHSNLVRIWWILYVILTFAALVVLIEQKKTRVLSVFFLMMAGGSNMVMLYSPIFGARSSLYFVYFMFAVVLLVFSEIEIPSYKIDCVLCVVLFCVVFLRGKSWYVKYRQVYQVQMIRESEIQYYVEHPQEDAWICRMPPYSVHGSDIEEGDTYHFDTFKEYYGLDANQKIFFYWKNSYDE